VETASHGQEATGGGYYRRRHSKARGREGSGWGGAGCDKEWCHLFIGRGKVVERQGQAHDPRAAGSNGGSALPATESERQRRIYGLTAGCDSSSSGEPGYGADGVLRRCCWRGGDGLCR
jgi:hypothetical protein